MNYQDQDPEVWQAIADEQQRQEQNIELIVRKILFHQQLEQHKVQF